MRILIFATLLALLPATALGQKLDHIWHSIRSVDVDSTALIGVGPVNSQTITANEGRYTTFVVYLAGSIYLELAKTDFIRPGKSAVVFRFETVGDALHAFSGEGRSCGALPVEAYLPDGRAFPFYTKVSCTGAGRIDLEGYIFSPEYNDLIDQLRAAGRMPIGTVALDRVEVRFGRRARQERFAKMLQGVGYKHTGDGVYTKPGEPSFMLTYRLFRRERIRTYPVDIRDYVR